jgi:PAS domain S-box-containing protein
MALRRRTGRLWAWSSAAMVAVCAYAFIVQAAPNETASDPVITNAEAVRELTPEQANRKLPVRLSGVVTFFFNGTSFFVQDESAGIYVGGGIESPPLTPGDRLLIEGVTGPGEYAPIVRPASVRLVGHTNLPPARQVSFEDLMTGREDSQWVELTGLIRAVQIDPGNQPILEMASGGRRLTVLMPPAMQTNLPGWVDSRVRVRGVCGTWFNKLRQLFGVRLMVPRPADINFEEAARTDALAEPARPISDILRFGPHASYGHRVKLAATVVLQQPGRALFVEDGQSGLYVQTRQAGALRPGDRVELVGFPEKGEYTPVLQDAIWSLVGSGPEPQPTLIGPDEALNGSHDSRLVSIEGLLLDHAQNRREVVLGLAAGDHIFSAQFEWGGAERMLAQLQNNSYLRVTGVCRIEVGEDWRAGPEWRAKSFRILMRGPNDIHVLRSPSWWSLTRLLWAVGILAGVVLASLGWVTLLHRKVGQQTTIIRKQLDLEATLRERYEDLFESANDVVYTHDLAGRITAINKAGEQLLGWSRAAIHQKSLLDFIPEEQRPAARQWLQDIVDGTAPTAVEWDFVTAGGERINLEISTRLIEHQGRQIEIEGVARDVTERRRLEKEISEISTREQRRIGHDLHDGVCQQLAATAFLSEILADKLGEQNRPEATEARKITELVNQANQQTRGVARGLFPVRLEENGLVSALEELAENAAAFFDTRCEFYCESPVSIQSLAVAHHLYFIAQEAMLNAVKHGKASLIEIRLSADGDNAGMLVIRDNGHGFVSPPADARGMGIRIMRFRAKMIGGGIQIQPRAERGTEVLCRFACEPVPAPPALANAKWPTSS